MKRLTVGDIVRQPLPGMDAPTKVRFTPDGGALTYLQGPPDSLVRSLWRHDLATGERRLLAGPADTPSTENGTRSRDEELQRERRREHGEGITDYQVADDGTLLVMRAGRLFVSRDGQPVEPLPAIEGIQDARLAPDGRRVAFVQSGELFVAPTIGSPPLRLTDDAQPGVSNGLAEYVAAEELARFVGTWWSTNAKHIAFAHVDERPVAPVTIQHLGDEEGTQEEHRYPFAGGPNARVSLRVTSAAGGDPREVDLGMEADDYLARVVAHPAGGWLVAVLPRDQRSLRWLRVAADASATEVWVERSEPWLNLDDDTRVLPDGRILRTTERTGFRHLELRQPDGQFDRQLTSGDWVVTSVVHVTPDNGEVFFIATRDGVLERHVYSVPLTGGEPQRLSEEPGWHEAAFSSDGPCWVDTWSSLEHSPAVAVRFRDGSAPLVIHRSSASPASLDLPAPQLHELRAADDVTTLHAAIYEPQSRERAPAVVWVYGGPHSQKVANEWSLTVELHRQVLRQLGFIVVVVDNRGTFNRGLGFEAPLSGAMGTVEVADQAAAVRQLAAAGVLDAGRVGITGASYGGYMTLMAMLRESELFRAGVAVAPVIDWRLYDTAYTERYLGMPLEQPRAYEQSSVVPHVAELRGRALVMHGLIDENVLFRHTARLLAVMAEADRDVELLVFPAERHGERRPAARRQRQRRALEFLCRQLGQPLPPETLAGE
jgi:dipeptidyl-peptidase 4